MGEYGCSGQRCGMNVEMNVVEMHVVGVNVEGECCGGECCWDSSSGSTHSTFWSRQL